MAITNITPKSGERNRRKRISGMWGAWTKMWDPPIESPTTPETVPVLSPASPYYNPVPAFMAATVPGYNGNADHFVERALLGGITIPTWDNQIDMRFMAFEDPDAPSDVTPAWPGPTIRHPRGKMFQCNAQGKGPPPHTIHWHGLEPTPMNDGVGHCSMEIGQYMYQFQPNWIGTYFYHCHRNTVQHFEFGLYGMFLVEPPDAYDPSIPNVAGEVTKNVGGYPRRTAANLDNFPLIPEYVPGHPTYGVVNGDTDPVTDPHAFTVAYDREALWVFDDRDSNWSELANHAKAFYPGGANTNDGAGGELLPVPVADTQAPGVDDQFANGFFNDYNADYWYVTGQPIPAAQGGTASIGSGLAIPASLNGGVTGMTVDVSGNVNETILVRVLNGAYNVTEVTFPVDIIIIAWDGRALGVPPFARYNHAYRVTAGTTIRLSTARRFDALIREPLPVNTAAEVKFFDTRGIEKGTSGTPLVTGQIPIVIS